ncbi:uncharacterized protein LOC129105860 isoform X2 [Anoplopoma fimbria]|uniref:uncharacterized protein LOC129105860 isoform X2 n=1 Tax=Anoplopoma fimbria TaxID=229290 RepID=UPI0023ECC592|nr:uncharacterized protein LOC129105860 isoform X2 [Anoplopoma fimbria]
MAPTAPFTLQWQTDQIIKCLLDIEDEDSPQCRLLDCNLEVDSSSAESREDTFDPVVIADKLRTVADAMAEDVHFRAALTEMRQAAAQEAFEAAFSHGVDAICQTQVAQRAEVVSEMQLIKASVSFGLYVKKSCPELKHKIQSVMSSFLTARVGPWVTQQGGWEKVV